MTASDAISFRTDPEPVPVAVAASPAEAVDYANPQHAKYTPPMRLLALPNPREAFAERAFWTLIALAVAGLYLLALLSYWAPAHPGTDQNGYFAGGRQFASTLSTGMKPESDYGFIGRMWITAPSGISYPKYPLGLPILYAASLWIFGDRGVEVAHLISPISAALATLGVFAITRRLSGGFMGVMAMLLMACGQTMLTLAINPNSHAACTCAVVWGIFFLLRWLETGTIWRGIAAGALFGFAYMIRYTEGLLLLPMGVAMLYAAKWEWPRFKRASGTVGTTVLELGILTLIGFVVRHRTEGWLEPFTEDNGRMFKLMLAAIGIATVTSMFIERRSLVRLLAVGFAWLVPVAYLTLFNMIAMNSLTSYAGTNESTGFSLTYFDANWEKMVRVIHDQGVFFIAPLGVLGLVLMFRKLPLVAAILVLWFLPSVLLYTAYYWAPDNMGVSYSRFILTQLPALVIAAAWLMGELSRRLGGRTIEHGEFTRFAGAAVAVSLGLSLAVIGEWFYGPLDDRSWWLMVPTGLILMIVGVFGMASLASDRMRERFNMQFRGTLSRLAVASVVFISCGLGLHRSVLGSEWGQRVTVRANLEIQSRQNHNLAGLGRELRRAVDRPEKEATTRPANEDRNVLVFSEGERLNHLQWIGGWQVFDTSAFAYDRATRQLTRTLDENEPDPIDPTRIKFLQGVYKDKDQRALQADQNALIENAIKGGKRVYFVLSDSTSKVFGRQIDRRQFEVKEVGTYNDAPSPRLEDDFLLPSERPKQPVNRFGRGNAFRGTNFLGNERMMYRIGQIVMKPKAAAPATSQSTVPSTSPTTQPATQP